MDITKKQHYVPRFYLKNFYLDNEMWALRGNKIYGTSIEDICTQSYLYETEWNQPPEKCKSQKFVLANQIENELSKKEHLYAESLKKIIRICNERDNSKKLIMYERDKTIMSSFIANLIVRNPMSIKTLLSNTDNAKESKELNPYKEVCSLLGINDFDSIVDFSYKNTITLEDEEGSEAFTIKNQLKGLYVYILIAPTDMPFVSASFPILFDTVELGEDEIILNSLFFPLTPHIGLYYSKSKKRGRVNRMTELSQSKVEELNRKLYENAEFIISPWKIILENMLKSKK